MGSSATCRVGARGVLSLGVLLCASGLVAQTYVDADGVTPAYTIFNNVLGGTATETPDCIHPEFGPHVTQAFDSTLAKQVFVFHMHVTPDNDRCVADDRQRMEVKTYGPSPAYLKGFFGDTVTYRWKFKLDAGFQPSPNFTHIHQIKAGDGTNADAPIFTLTPRTATPEQLELKHVGSTGVTTNLAIVPLADFKGEWVEAYERVTYADPGAYSVVVTRLRDGAVLLSYSTSNIETWRTGGTTFVRPKWGIYRSLLSSSYLRDEQVRFDHFCLAKGTDDCPGGTPPPPDTQAPTAPTSLAVTGVTGSTVGLSWGASTDNVGVVGYDVYRDGAFVATTAATTYTVGGLSPNTTYSFTVNAKDAAGNVSPASNTATATTTAAGDTQAPTAPANLASTAKTATTVSLAWGASTDNVAVVAYDVFRDGALAGSVTSTSAIVTGLARATSYTFTVKARDAAGNVSAASNAVTVRTLRK